MKGRKPTPTVLKRLQGNPGKRPLAKREPQPRSEPELPPPPEWLAARAAVRVERDSSRWIGVWEAQGEEVEEVLTVPGKKGPRQARTRAEAERAAAALAQEVGATGEAAEVWYRVGAELHRLGLLTVVDYDAFSAFCQAVADYRWAQRTLAAGKMFIKTPKGFVQEHPAVHVRNRAAEQIRQFGSEFGLSPSARARIVPARQEADDPFEAFLREGRSA